MTRHEQASSGHDRSIVVFRMRCVFADTPDNVEDRKEEHTVKVALSNIVQVPCAHYEDITAIAVSHDGRFVATGSADMLLKIWDIHMPGMPTPPFQSFVGHSSTIRDVAFTANDNALISIAGHQMLRWDFLSSDMQVRFESTNKHVQHHVSSTSSMSSSEHVTASPISPTKRSEGVLDESPVLRLRSALRKRAVTIGQVFGFMDKDRSNALSFNEMTEGLKLASVHLDSLDAKALFRAMDPNEDGRISWVEFKSAIEGCDDGSSERTNADKTRATDDGTSIEADPKRIAHVSGGVRCVAWYPPSALMAYSIRNHVIVEMLESQTSEETAQPDCRQVVAMSHEYDVRSICISADGEMLASASEAFVCVHLLRGLRNRTSSLELWRSHPFESSKPRTTTFADGENLSLSFDPTCRRLAYVTSANRIVIWDARSGEVIQSLDARSAITTSPLWASHWTLLVGTSAPSLTMWSVKEWSPRHLTLPTWVVASGIIVTALSSVPTISSQIGRADPCDQEIVAGFSDGRVSIFRITTHFEVEVVKTFHGLSSPCPVRHFSWSQRSRSSERRGKEEERKQNMSSYQTLVVCGNHDTFDTFSLGWFKSDGALMRRNYRVDVERIHRMRVDGTSVRSAVFGSSVREGIMSTKSGTMWFVDTSNSKAVRLRGGPLGCVDALTVSASGSHVVSLSAGSISFWKTDQMKQVVHMTCHRGNGDGFAKCLCVSMSKSSRDEDEWLVAGFDDGSVRIVNLSTMKVARRSVLPSRTVKDKTILAPVAHVSFCYSSALDKREAFIVASTSDRAVFVSIFSVVRPSSATMKWSKVDTPNRDLFTHESNAEVVSLYSTSRISDRSMFAMLVQSEDRDDTTICVWEFQPTERRGQSVVGSGRDVKNTRSRSSVTSSSIVALVDVESILRQLEKTSESDMTSQTQAGLSTTSASHQRDVVSTFASNKSSTLVIAASRRGGDAVHVVVYSFVASCIMSSFTTNVGRPSLSDRVDLFVPTAIATTTLGDDMERDDSVVAISCTRGCILLVDIDSGSLLSRLIVPFVSEISCVAMSPASPPSTRRLYASSTGAMYQWGI